MAECPADGVVAAFVAGALPSAEIETIATHVDACAICREEVAVLAAWASSNPSAHGEASAPLQIAEGDRIGRYIVLYPIGRGGMGCVFAAYDCTLDRKVALKLPLARRSTSLVDPQVSGEASAMAKLSHPNVVTVFEVGAWGGRTFIAMELVDGATLRQYVVSDELAQRSWAERLRLILQAGDGLAAAHAQGLVHRDFKPDNVLVGRDRRARVSDFGLATRVASVPGPMPGVAAHRPTGAPIYWAPELCAIAQGTPKADQYALCATAWELLIESPSNRSLPRTNALTLRRVRAVLDRGMRPDPGERYADVPSLLRELRGAASNRRFAAWIAASAVAGAGLVLGTANSAPRSDQAQAEARAAAAMAPVWNGARAQAMNERLSALGPVVGPEAIAAVEQAVDRLAHAWIDTRVEVWQDHEDGMTSPEVRDWRSGCLEERKAQLDSAIEVLLHPNNQTAKNAIPVVYGLRSPMRCSVQAALRADEAGRPQPHLAGQVQDLELRLARSKVLLDVGLYDRALHDIDAATGEARTVAFAPVLSRALLLRGDAHAKQGEFESARTDVYEAARFAAMNGDHAQLAGVWVNWALYLANGGGAPDQASVWADAAGTLVDGLDDDPELRGWLSIARGDISHQTGRWQDALEHYESARASLAEHAGDNHPLVGLMLANMALAHAAVGRNLEAKAGFEAAIERDTLLLGRGHPRIGSMELGLANALRDLGELPEAQQVAQRALQDLSAALPPQHHDVGKAHYTLATILHELSDNDDAEVHAQRALAIVRQRHGEDHADTSFALWLLGRVALDRGDHDLALARVERALAAIGDHPHATVEALNLLKSEVVTAQEHACNAADRRSDRLPQNGT